MSRWRSYLVDERLGVRVLVEPLRWRIEVLTTCPADVREALAEGEPMEGAARNERDAIERGLVALGRLQGWLLARRQPRQAHIFAAEHFDQLRDQDWLDLRVGVQAACLAYERGWTWVAGSLLQNTREVSAGRYGLTEAAHAVARSLADRCAAAMRRRRLPL